MQPLGTQAPDFSLPEPATGERRKRDDFADADALLVVFMCNHCPYVIHIREALRDFAEEYRPKGLAVVGINANDPSTHPGDSPEAMKREVREVGYTFPYLFDETQDVAKAYGAACTPDFFLYDGDRRLVYRGQFDGSRPSNGVPVTGEDLRAAADTVLAGGKPDPEAQKASAGCNIKWRDGNAPEWFG
jgi:peroxiredoxin